MNLIEQAAHLSPVDISPQPGIREARPTLLCLSHLRWGFVYQRPQHVMSRLAADYEVLFFEEPVFIDAAEPRLDASRPGPGLTVLVPRLPIGMDAPHCVAAQRQLLDQHLASMASDELLLWYLTPMSLEFTEHLKAQVTIFDCMDELSAFMGAPLDLVARERQLLSRADVVFTGGHSLWQAKKSQHPNAHAFPSSVDIAHFAAAREPLPEPGDQACIGYPRLGFFGVIDERFDTQLVGQLAAQHPQWQIVLIGPVVKIDPATLPREANIHYLGAKTYAELPAYLAGWNVALMPFAINDSTRFISPTKTPEYLAGGCPVVSTPIQDVVSEYGDSDVVSIAASPAAFIAAIAGLLDAKADPGFLGRVDEVLGDRSWDKTCAAMKEHIECLR